MVMYVAVCCCILLYIVACCCIMLYVVVCCCELLQVVCRMHPTTAFCRENDDWRNKKSSVAPSTVRKLILKKFKNNL